MTPDADLANCALDGVLKIIGEPSPEEKIYAISLENDGVGGVITNASGTIKYKNKLLTNERKAESALASDFHSYAAQASTLKFITAIAISAVIALVIARIFGRVM
jgi:hypothetical protein